MDYIPLNYRELNIASNMFMPNTVRSFNNKTFQYWVRSLYQRACSVFEFEVPETWEGAPTDFLYYCLFRFGYVVVWNDPKFGYTFNPCTLSGRNIYYQFTNALVTNEALNKKKTLDIKLGKTGELLKISPDYFPLFDTIYYYAEKISTLDVALNTSLINSKVGMILGAKNKSVASTLAVCLDKINRGEPSVIVSKAIADDQTTKDTPFQLLERDLKKNYITTDLLNDFQTLINNFDAEVGIPSLPYQKKERLVTKEAESREVDATARSMVWFDTLVNSIEKIKELYPDIKLDVKLRYDTDNGGDDFVYRENDFNRPS